MKCQAMSIFVRDNTDCVRSFQTARRLMQELSVEEKKFKRDFIWEDVLEPSQIYTGATN